MADSDEDLAALGTPFEELEDDAPRKKPVPIHEQIVTDERGRRRFHGAFTGGFSAGYFNTVDTKEGWTPKTFVSSRSQKATDHTMQKPEDFMDEEDLGEFGIAPKRVVTTEKFLPTDKEGKQRKRVLGPARPSETDRSVSGIIQSSEVLQDLIVPVKMSVGVKLLTQMGWKQGQGIGPRVRRSTRKTYGCAPQSSSSKEEDEGDIYAAGLMFAPKDVKSIEYTSKDNLHGIGYSGINPKTVLLNQRDWLGLEPTPTIAGIKGQGFGVGALEEEDDDIYRQDHLSNYDIDLNVSSSRKRNELHGWTGPPQTSEQGGLLSVFTKVSKPPTRKVYPPPVVPRDFVPLHKVDAKLKETQITENTQNISLTKPGNVKLTAKERGEALGEKPLPTPRKSVFDYVAEEDKTRLKESQEKEKPKQQSRWSDSDNAHSSVNVPKGMVFKSSGFKPFAKDPQKQARYEDFLSGKTSDVHQPGTDSKMTEWERECEAEEFVRAATLYRPLSQTMAARFTSAKESEEPSTSEEPGLKEHKSAATTKIFGAMTRQRFEWHPDRILCKRFNIPDPYPGSGSTGIPSGQKTKSSMDVKVVEDVKSIEYKPDDEIRDENRGDDDTKTSALIAGFQAMASRPPVATQETKLPGVSSSQVETNVDENSDVVKLASMDLFKAVFAESSSESDSEESEKEEDDNEEETKGVDVDEKEKSNESDSNMFQTNNTKSNDFSSQNEKVISEYPDQLEEQKKQSVYSANDTFGPALPTSNTCRSFQLTDSRESGKERERKYKQKKKKKEKSYKYMETDSEDSMEGQYERYKSKRKERSEKDIYKHKSKSKKKSHSKYSENENSEEDYRNYNKHKKKKEKKSKDERKHKSKDISKKQRRSIINWEDYEEKTFDSNVASNSKKDYTRFHQEKTSERWKTDSKQGKSEDKSDDDTESGSMNQDIMSKLKNIQRLKEGRRMRAADFM